MGNFSRDTFDPQKNYIGVRLQQGVPVLDADWNELNDVTRQELYDTISLTFTDGVLPGSTDFAVQQVNPAANDVLVFPGTALVGGRSVRLPQTLRYTSQRWVDKEQAKLAGVDFIPALTIPPGPANPRTDLVYLDVWEREIDSTEDPNLINHAIGVETSVRLKREVAVRVAEGTTTLPAAPSRHAFLPLALIKRVINQTAISANQIEDKRPFIRSPRGAQVFSFLPSFVPMIIPFNPTQAWQVTPFTSLFTSEPVPKFLSENQGDKTTGVLPLALPDGIRMTSLRITASITGTGKLEWQLVRANLQAIDGTMDPRKFFDVVANDTIESITSGPLFNTPYSFATTEPRFIVDNSRYYYCLVATVPPPHATVRIQGVSITGGYFNS